MWLGKKVRNLLVFRPQLFSNIIFTDILEHVWVHNKKDFCIIVFLVQLKNLRSKYLRGPSQFTSIISYPLRFLIYINAFGWKRADTLKYHLHLRRLALKRCTICSLILYATTFYFCLQKRENFCKCLSYLVKLSTIE